MKENNLIKYSMQLAFLKQLLEKRLITDKEYALIKKQLMIYSITILLFYQEII